MITFKLLHKKILQIRTCKSAEIDQADFINVNYFNYLILNV